MFDVADGGIFKNETAYLLKEIYFGLGELDYFLKFTVLYTLNIEVIFHQIKLKSSSSFKMLFLF